MNAETGAFRALVIEHERETPGGLLYQWLRERGAQVETYPIDLEKRTIDLREYGLIASMGSEFAPHDDSIPWLRREINLMREATRLDVPILGICFGGQLLSRTLGGRVWRSRESEVGWFSVRSDDPDLVPEGPWFQWHFDVFSPPPGAKEVAVTSVCSQAFTIGRSMGVQFHPEVTPEIMEKWVEVYKHELDAEGVDPHRLVEETKELVRSTRSAAWQLFDRFFERSITGQDGDVTSEG